VPHLARAAAPTAASRPAGWSAALRDPDGRRPGSGAASDCAPPGGLRRSSRGGSAPAGCAAPAPPPVAISASGSGRQPRPPFLVGGTGMRLLGMAAQEADIVAFDSGPATQDPTSWTLAAQAEKARLVPEAAASPTWSSTSTQTCGRSPPTGAGPSRLLRVLPALTRTRSGALPTSWRERWNSPPLPICIRNGPRGPKTQRSENRMSRVWSDRCRSA
jgi:hypothetical protein